MKTPVAVAEYLSAIPDSNDRSLSYLKLDSNHRVVDNGGTLIARGFEPPLDLNTSIDDQIIPLSGILPVIGKPLVIHNAQLHHGVFIDIHVFCDEGFHWVIFLDNTKAGAKLQEEQQLRLSHDIAEECRRAGGS